MYDLKIDRNLPYHYFISVGVRSALDHDPGRFFLKHGPLKYTNDDVENVRDAKMLSEDKLYKTSNKDAMNIFNCTEIIHAIWSMLRAADANQCSVHHFSSDMPIDDDFWPGFVERANTNRFEREKLDGSRIGHSRGFV